MMRELIVNGQELLALGVPQGRVIGVLMDTLQKFFKEDERESALSRVKEVLSDPAGFTDDPVFGEAAQLLGKQKHRGAGLRDSPVDFSIFGREYIDQSALEQMHLASRLPIALGGSLMPDAHHGYGLPIGGVLATENAIIPYGVGVDIGCRMSLSIFDIAPKELVEKEAFFTREINEATLFGAGEGFEIAGEHTVLDRAEFKETELLRSLQQRAAHQLGTSGGGNHFVEFGVVDIGEYDDVLGVKPGRYVGLLSHSGSRGLGATIANYYTKVAREMRGLPKEAAHLSWFQLNEAEGEEYWRAMNLAGDYASANHEVIHQKIARQLGRQPLRKVENHHNFAWKESWNGKEVIVHRKGATPAGKDVLGVIPGSMTAPGFIVKGKGETTALNSASHGAGRQMSRTEALKTITHQQLQQELKKKEVKLISAGLDESPFAYKDIKEVMRAQTDLVETVGTFTPRIVKMAGSKGKGRRKGKR